MLVSKVGVRHVELVEDAVQSAFLYVITSWNVQPLPHELSAWLYRVAYNRVIQDLRLSSGRQRILNKMAGRVFEQSLPEAPALPGEIRDDMLRMLFICCDEALPPESQLVFALKTLCGFSAPEIALRLFTSEANVYKRLGRARDRLRHTAPDTETPSLEQLRCRLSSVHRVLYLLFNEGYLSARDDMVIRRELCDEAVRLTTLVIEHPVGAIPESFALLALMHLHLARLGSRTDVTGGLLLLEEQDRTLWDQGRILCGMECLERSANGNVFSRFHAEAGIAAEHCLASSYRDTRWEEIVTLYIILEHTAASPLHTLNKAVAVAEWKGAEAGLAVLDGLAPPAWLAGSYLWDAVQADLHGRAGHSVIAAQHQERALNSAPSVAVRKLLLRRWSFANQSAPA